MTVCSECNRHVRIGEQACPFCGARVEGFIPVLEYRLKTRISRGQAFSLGAALTAAGFMTSCEESVAPPYGIACTPTICPALAGSSTGGNAGSTHNGGSAGQAGSSNGGHAGTAPGGGSTAGGSGGSSALGGAAGDAAGQGGQENGGAGGSGSDAEAGSGGAQ